MAEDTQEPLTQDPPSKASKLYNNLLSDGYTPKNLGSEEEFTSALSDPSKAAKIYNGLLGDGYTVKNLGGMDDFLNTFTKNTAVSQRPSSYPIKPTGFAANINMGEAQKPLSINLHPAPEQTEQQPEAPSIENNFGFNQTGQQNVADNTTNVAPQQALEKVDFDVNHVQRVKQQEQYTNQAIDNATAKALKLKGINAQPGSVQYNQQRNEFVKQVQNGDATVNTKNGEAGLERTTGFLENIKNGWNEATTGADEADDFANKMTAQERVDYLNKKQSEQKTSPYIGEKPNLLGSTGHLIGSSVPFLAKAGAGAVIGAGAVAAAPESMGASLAGLPTAMSFMLTAPDMVNQGVQQEVSRRYQILKHEHPERSDVENMEEAGKGALVGGVGGILENAALMGTGMNTPILSESKSLIGQTVNKIINSGVHLGTVSAGITAAEQEIGNLQGIKTSQSDILKNSLESFKEGATTGAALTALMHVPQMPKILKSVFKDAIVRNENPQTVANVLQANENVGNIPEGTTQKVMADLNGYREALGKIPDGLSTEAQSSIAGLIQKKNNLIEEAKTKDDSFKDFYKQKTDAIDQQISDIQRTGKPFEHEIDEATGKPYEPPTYDEVAQQRVQELAKKISKNADISDPQSIQTQQNFPEQLKSELQNIADVEKKNNEGKENPNTEVADNAENYIKKNLSKTEETPVQDEAKPSTDNVSRETSDNENEPKVNDNTPEVNKPLPENEVKPEEQGNKGNVPESVEPVGQGGTEGEPTVLKTQNQPKTSSTEKPKKQTLKSQVDAIEEPTNPEDIVLQYFGGGNKIHTSAIDELYGGKDERIRQGASTEGERRKHISMLSGKEPTIKQLAHKLWDSAPEEVQKNYDDTAFREAIENTLKNHTSSSSAAREFIRRNADVKAKENFTKDEYEQIENDYKSAIDKHLEELPEEQKNQLRGILKKYQNEYGLVDWGKLEKDTNGFDPELLSLPDKTSNALDEIIKRNTDSGRSEPENTPLQNSVEKEGENPKETSAGKSNEVKETEKLISNAQEELRVAKESIASKRKELDKTLIEDQEDLFGGRKSSGNKLFDERVDPTQREKALEPYKERVNKAQAELDRLNKVLDKYQNEPTAQLEIKLNKSEERAFKQKIKKADADEILKSEGLTPETVDKHKDLFNGDPYTPQDLKNIKNDRRIKEPAADGQENTSRTGDKKTGDEIKAAEVKDAKGENGVPENKGGENTDAEIQKVAFARSNSYDSYKLLHPKESVEDYNKVRNSDVEIPTGDLRKLSKEYMKDQPNKEAASTQKFYEEIAGSKPAQTGRIPVAPIIGEAKELSKIILDVANAINQKISFLKPGRKAAGTYNSGNAGIKIKFNGDLDVTAHEIGHSIDDHFGLLKDLVKQPDLEIEAELNKFSPYGSKPPKGHPDPGKYTRGEGFAEWLRSYIVNPNEAIKQAPKLYDLYKSKVSEAYQKAMTDFSNDVRTWAGSTGRDMTLSNIEWEPEKAKGLIKQVLSKKGNDMFSISFADKLAANWVNPMRAFEKAFNYARGIKGLDQVLPENDPTILARLFLSIDRKFGEFLDHGLRDSKDQLIKNKDGNPITFKWLIEPLDNTDMASIKREMQDVTAYMIAERTVELGNRFKRDEILTGIGGGIYKDVQVAKKTLDEFNNGDPTRLERIKEAASRYREFADSNLKYMVDKGRLSKEAYDEIKKNNLQYVALHRIMEAEPETEIQVFKGGSKSIASVSQPVQSIKGSTKKISNPYTSLLDSMYKSLKESERNDVLRAFRDMLVNNRGMYEGDPKKLAEVGVLAKSGDKNTITIFVDGKPEKWAFQKDVYEALKGLDKEAYKLPGIATWHAKVLRNMTTKFPTFAVRNKIRDMQDWLIKSNEHPRLKDLFGDKEHWRDVARKGGLNSGYYVRDKAHYYGLMEQAMDELSKNQKTIFADPIKIKSLWHGYERILETSETSTRVAEYRAAFRNGKRKGMDDYNAGLYAAFKSRDLMDFAVMGHYMKLVNQVIPFSNAAVQGVRAGLVRAHENPVGFLMRTAVYSVLPQVALWWWNHRDDDTAKKYEQMPAYQKDMFYNMKIGDNKWLSIPKPYELGMLAAGVDRGLSAGYGYNINAFEGYAGDVFKAISPVDQSTLFGPAEPIIETISNYDEFRDKHIISPEEDELNLALRHTETASWLSQQIQKVAQIDARKIDFLIRSQFSYVGNEGLKLTDKAAKLAGADIQTNRNDFDLTDLGIFKRTPAYNAPVVQDMMEFAKEWRLDRSREYKEFKNLAAKYFDTDDDSKKEEYSKQMIDLAQNLLDTWKAQGIDEKVKAKEQKKRLQNKK